MLFSLYRHGNSCARDDSGNQDGYGENRQGSGNIFP